MAKRANGPGLARRMQGLRGEARLEALGEVVAQWRASGKSRAAFCREVGIAAVTLSRWLRKVDSNRAAEATPVFVEVGTHEPRNRDIFEVQLSNGTRVRVPAGFVEGDLVRLLGVLATVC